MSTSPSATIAEPEPETGSDVSPDTDQSRQNRFDHFPKALRQKNNWREEIDREIDLCEFYDHLTPLKQRAFKKTMIRMGEIMPAPIRQSRPVITRNDFTTPCSPLRIPTRLLKLNHGNAEEVLEIDLSDPSTLPVTSIIHQAPESGQSHTLESINTIQQSPSIASPKRPVIYMPNFRISNIQFDETKIGSSIMDCASQRQTQSHCEFRENLVATTSTISVPSTEESAQTPNESRKMSPGETSLGFDLKRASNSIDIAVEMGTKIKKKWDGAASDAPPILRSEIELGMNPTNMTWKPATELFASYCPPTLFSTNTPRQIPAYLTLNHPVPPPSNAVKFPVKTMPASRPLYIPVPIHMMLGNGHSDEEFSEKPPPELRYTMNANPFADIQPPMGSEPIENPHLSPLLNDDELASPCFHSVTIEQPLHAPIPESTAKVKCGALVEEGKIITKTKTVLGMCQAECQRSADANNRRSISRLKTVKKSSIHRRFLNIAAKGQAYIVGKCTIAEMDKLESFAKGIEDVLDKVRNRSLLIARQLQDEEQKEIVRKESLEGLCNDKQLIEVQTNKTKDVMNSKLVKAGRKSGKKSSKQ